MRISDWSSDVCSSDLPVTSQVQWRHDLSAALSSLASQPFDLDQGPVVTAALFVPDQPVVAGCAMALGVVFHHAVADGSSLPIFLDDLVAAYDAALTGTAANRSEEHTSELQSLMRISYAVFCLKKKTNKQPRPNQSAN